MLLAKYCKDKGMTKEEFLNFKKNIESTAEAIRSTLIYKGGMYFPTTELFNWNSDENMKHFIIQALKELGLEFITNDEYYRVTD